jgi:hypothetical protein
MSGRTQVKRKACVTPLECGEQIAELVYAPESASESLFKDPDAALQTLSDSINQFFSDYMLSSSPISAPSPAMADVIGDVMGELLSTGFLFDRAYSDQIAESIFALQCQPYLMGSVLESWLLAPPGDKPLLTFSGPDGGVNSWEAGKSASSHIYDGLVAAFSASSAGMGFVFNDTIVAGLAGEGWVPELKDALFSEDVYPLYLALQQVIWKLRENAGLDFGPQDEGDYNPYASTLLFIIAIAQVGSAWHEQTGEWLTVETQYGEVDLADFVSVSVAFFNSVRMGYTKISQEQNFYMEAVEKRAPPLPYYSFGEVSGALSQWADVGFLLKDYDTFNVCEIAEATGEFYTSEWADPGRIMLINFGAIALAGIIKGR